MMGTGLIHLNSWSALVKNPASLTSSRPLEIARQVAVAIMLSAVVGRNLSLLSHCLQTNPVPRST